MTSIIKAYRTPGFRSILHSFSVDTAGGRMKAGLILSSNTPYGTTEYGGIGNYGTVFAINTDGSGFTNLYDFTSAAAYPFTNRDGAYPVSLHNRE